MSVVFMGRGHRYTAGVGGCVDASVRSPMAAAYLNDYLPACMRTEAAAPLISYTVTLLTPATSSRMSRPRETDIQTDIPTRLSAADRCAATTVVAVYDRFT
eukprot:GHVU01055254.1.p1 GENE.GHVU01055254.1~~GHVU01055254.1.p1  ORF type:complete len:101 (-),score=4.53 GHVU01055254.1:33-335(-)